MAMLQVPVSFYFLHKLAPLALSTNMATSGAFLLLTILNIFLISNVLATDDDVSGLQRIFRLSKLFDSINIFEISACKIKHFLF